MIEILYYKAFANSKNCLKGTLTLRIPTEYGNLLIKNISYFEKGDNRWVSFPQKEIVTAEKKTYMLNMFFENKEYRELFQKEMIEALDLHIAKKAQEEIKPAQQEPISNIPYNEDVPF